MEATARPASSASSALRDRDPGAGNDDAQHRRLSIRIGLGWAKSRSFAAGQSQVIDRTAR